MIADLEDDIEALKDELAIEAEEFADGHGVPRRHVWWTTSGRVVHDSSVFRPV